MPITNYQNTMSTKKPKIALLFCGGLALGAIKTNKASHSERSEESLRRY